jgi:hypothetical protein
MNYFLANSCHRHVVPAFKKRKTAPAPDTRIAEDEEELDEDEQGGEEEVSDEGGAPLPGEDDEDEADGEGDEDDEHVNNAKSDLPGAPAVAAAKLNAQIRNKVELEEAEDEE